MLTVRSFGSGHGSVIQRVQVNGTASVTPRSNVFASVCEQNRDTQTRFIGSARMYVCNIAPGAGLVDVWVQIDWDNDLEFELTLLIADDV